MRMEMKISYDEQTDSYVSNCSKCGKKFDVTDISAWNIFESEDFYGQVCIKCYVELLHAYWYQRASFEEGVDET